MFSLVIPSNEHTSIIALARKLAPRSDSNDSGTPNMGTISSATSGAIRWCRENLRPLRQEVLEDYNVSISSLSDHEFHKVFTKNLERTLYWNWMEWRYIFPSCSRDDCTVTTAFAELHDIPVDRSPPPLATDHTVQLPTREMSCIHSSKALLKDILS